MQRWRCPAQRCVLPTLVPAVLLGLLVRGMGLLLLLLSSRWGVGLPVLLLLLWLRRRHPTTAEALGPALLCPLPAAAAKEAEQAGLVGLARALCSSTCPCSATWARPARTTRPWLPLLPLLLLLSLLLLPLLLLLGWRGCLTHEGRQDHLACRAHDRTEHSQSGGLGSPSSSATEQPLHTAADIFSWVHGHALLCSLAGAVARHW